MSSIIVKNATRGKVLTWRNVRVHKSLDDICHTLEVELNPADAQNVHKHDKIEVRYANPLIHDSGGARLVTTVLVDDITPGADISKHSLMVAGRSPARDIIDSTWSGTCNEKTLRDIIREVGKDFDITCYCLPHPETDSSEIVPVFEWNDESPWMKLIEKAAAQHTILTSNQAGDLYLWQVAGGARQEGFHLTEGSNIKSISSSENGARQFRTYIIKGGGNPDQTVTDDTCRGKRVLTICMNDEYVSEKEMLERAKTEMRRRRENRTTVTVSGWGLTDGQIKKNIGYNTIKKEIFWEVNFIIPVTAPSLELKRNLLTADVVLEASPDSLQSTITVVNREAYL